MGFARARAGVLLALAGIAVSACGDAAAHEVRVEAAPISTSSTTTTPTRVATTAATTIPAAPRWPLTGADAPSSRDLAHPAVVVKIDNYADARPQIGLNQADVVYEMRVEGISRFAAVFHSTAATPVGPVRSARTSDPSLLGGLRTPLLAWSGGNPTVRDVLRRAGGIGVLVDMGHDARPSLYWRDTARRAPHNLYTDTQALLDAAPPLMGAPLPVFSVRGDGDAPSTAGVPAAGAWVSFSKPGVPSAEYVWDAARRVWRRFQIDALHGLADSAHLDANGVQVAPTNLVVLEVPYRASAADARSPEAVTLGTGRATVLVDGRSITGTWTRNALGEPWELLDEAEKPISLAPGRTWVALVAAGDFGLLDATRASALLATRP